MSRSKFNVSDDKKKRTFNGIVFDSVLEMKFFKEVIIPAYSSGEIKAYELQKKYSLQPSFYIGEKLIRGIDYVADFYIQYADGREVVIDTKGCPDVAAKIKRKLFLYKYRDVDYQWIGYSKIDGGWVPYEAIQEGRRERKNKKRKS